MAADNRRLRPSIGAFLMELDQAYAGVIVQRWEQFTGRKAERVAANERADAGETSSA